MDFGGAWSPDWEKGMSELYIGVMSGTSLDGMDFIIAEVSESQSFTTIYFFHQPFEDRLRQEMLEAQSAETIDLSRLITLHGAFGALLAEGVETLLEKSGVEACDIVAIGLHGLTFRHCPEPFETPAGPGAGTLQVGDPHVLSAKTGIPVITDFRHADMAVGGQGAPPAPFLDKLLFSDANTGRILLNLGGIANLTFLPADGHTVCAFDSGPSNMIMDSLMRRHPTNPGPFDPEGINASKGKVIEPLLAQLLDHPYFAMKPPKSTGRKLFGDKFTQRFLDYPHQDYNDLLATAVRLTAVTVAKAALEQHPASCHPEDFQELIVSGGGAHNTTLMNLLKEILPMKISTTGDYQLHEDAKEAMLMAALAWAHCHGVPGNIPTVTGASRSMVLGARCGDGNRP